MPRSAFRSQENMFLNIFSGHAPMPVRCKKQIKGARMISERKNSAVRPNISTRRQMIAGVAVGMGSLAVDSKLWCSAQEQAMQEKPSTAANQTRTSLHQESNFKASPERIYGILLDSKQFTAFTGMPAEIDPKAGGAFSMFGGLIVGRNIELVPNQRIVQAWRPAHWDPGVYSIVRFELKPQDTGTVVVLDHSGFPQGEFDHLDSGWHGHYWEPLNKYLG
jgi:activator of HSP90 ATPase